MSSGKETDKAKAFIATESHDFKTVTLKYADGTEETMTEREYDRKYGIKPEEQYAVGEQMKLLM